ncbi:MAG: PAS domain S-box protein, partial [Aggregatilineales bacterium]
PQQIALIRSCARDATAAETLLALFKDLVHKRPSPAAAGADDAHCDDDGSRTYISLAERTRESEALLQAIRQTAPVGIALKDIDGRWLSVNWAFCQMLGYSEQELLAIDASAIAHPEDQARDHAQSNRVLRGEIDAYTLEKRYWRKDGGLVWVSLNKSAIRNTDGSLRCFLLIAQDISEQKRYLTALQESEALFRSAFEVSPIGIALLDPEGRWLRVNAVLCASLGYSEEELLLRDFQSLTHPDDLAADLALMAEMKCGRVDHQIVEKRYLHKEGRVVWVILAAAAVRDEAGEVVFFLIQVQDITERKLAEQALRESTRRFEELAANIPALVYRLHSFPGGWTRLEYVSPRFYELHRYPVDEAYRRVDFFADQIHPDDLAGYDAASRHAITSGTPFFWEGRLIIEDTVCWRRFSSVPTHQADGSIVWDGLETDITIAKRLQEAVIQQDRMSYALSKEKEMSMLRSQMLVRIGHEFRTPLSIIQSSTDILDRFLDRLTPEKRAQHIDRIQSQVRAIANLLNDINQILEIQSNLANPNCRLVHLEEAIQEAIDSLRLSQLIDVKVDPTALRLRTDPSLLHSILFHVLSNAVKYSEPGTTVTLQATLENDQIALRVTDQGRGIPLSERERIFEPFYRGATTGDISGIGVGLTLTRQAVTILGGTIEVERSDLTGTTFLVRLPQFADMPQLAEQPWAALE